MREVTADEIPPPPLLGPLLPTHVLDPEPSHRIGGTRGRCRGTVGLVAVVVALALRRTMGPDLDAPGHRGPARCWVVLGACCAWCMSWVCWGGAAVRSEDPGTLAGVRAATGEPGGREEAAGPHPPSDPQRRHGRCVSNNVSAVVH